MNITITKITFTGIITLLCIHLEALALPVVLLVIVMLIDYGTGLMAASHRGNEITSYRSINGIAKKICLVLLVAVGLVLDILVVYAKESFGLDFPWSFIFAALIAVWLTANEIISILENVQDIGAPIPPWLLPMVKNIRKKAESIPPQIDKEG